MAVSLGRDFRTSRFDADANRFCAGAGVLLSSVVQDAFHRSLAGLEFAVGTPGTIGGALRMNAGSRDEWLGARVASVTTYAPETGLVRRAGAEIAWGYRTSSFAPHDVLVECELAVEPADPFFIRGKMEASLARRKKTQPLTEPSCGSVFKNPEGASAGALIEQAGPQGRAPWRRPGVGGACELHREHGRLPRRPTSARSSNSYGRRCSRPMASNSRQKYGSSGSRRPQAAGRGPASSRSLGGSAPPARRAPSAGRAGAPGRGARGNARTPNPSAYRAIPGGRAASSAGRSARASQGRSPQAYAAPRMSSVRVGDLDRAARNDRARKTYRRHVVRLAILAAVVLTLAVGAAVLYFSDAFRIEEVQVEGVEHLTTTEMEALAGVPSAPRFCAWTRAPSSRTCCATPG